MQELLAARAQGRSTTKAHRLYVLGGLNALKCGVCGSAMVGVPRTCRGKSYITYRCPNHNRKDPAACPTKEIPAEMLNNLVIKHVVANCFREELVPVLNQLLVNDAGSDGLRHQRNGIIRKINNLTKSLEHRYSEALVTRLEHLENIKASLDAQLEQEQTPSQSITKENFKQLRKKLYKYLMTSSDPEARDFLRNVIQEVRITNETVTFTLNID